MKNNGKNFENDFKNSFPEEGFIYRLRDSGSTYGGCKNNNLRFSVTNMCDYIAYYKKHLFCLELKSTLQCSLPNKNINKRQIDKLLSANEKDGVHSFIIINFSSKDLSKNEVFAIDIVKINDYINSNIRKSIPIQWCKENGTLIQSYLKRTHFKYKIEEFLDKIVKENF